MTRSEFMARMVIQHLSVDRAAKYAKALEENEEFEGWDEEDDGASWEEVLPLVAAAENALSRAPRHIDHSRRFARCARAIPAGRGRARRGRVTGS